MNAGLRELVFSAVYRVPCAFGNVDDFVDYLTKHVSEESANAGNVVSAILRFAEASDDPPAPLTPESALRWAVSRDIKRVEALLLQAAEDTDIATADILGTLPSLLADLKGWGLATPDPYVTIVDRFPPPFENSGASALCPDYEDERRYGMRRGIYFRRDLIRPVYSEILLAHELIHLFPGENAPELLAMGLEEGIADLLGTVYLGKSVHGIAAVGAFLTYARHGLHRPRVWTLYLDYLRQAVYLQDRYGIEGVVELVRRGRAAIHNTEKTLFMGLVNKIDLPPSSVNHDAEADALLTTLVRCPLPNYYLTPEEYVLSHYIEEGGTAAALALQLGTTEERIRLLLRSIASKTGMIVTSEGTIAYSNAWLYQNPSNAAKFAPPVLRYDLRV